MRVPARLLATGLGALALGVGILVAAGDKPMVWQPIVPQTEVEDLVKYLGQAEQDTLKAGAPGDSDAKKDWNAKVRNIPLLIAVLTQSAKGGNAQQWAGVRAAALQLSEAAEKGQLSEAKAQAATLVSLKPTAKGNPEPAALDEKADVGDMMNLLKLRGKGGLGFGPKAAPGNTDGIEARLMGLAKRKLPAATLKKEAGEIVRAAYIMAAIAEVTDAHTPKKKVGDKDPKEWVAETREMLESSLALAEAAKAMDAEKVKAAANKLNNSCNTCHGTFRE